jgi:hypothetical protein
MRKVTFNLSLNKAHDSPIYEDELPKQWYSNSDIKRIRSQMLQLAERENAKPGAYSYAAVIRGAYTVCCKADRDTTYVLNEAQQNLLVGYIATHPRLFGLDKYVKGCKPSRIHQYRSNAVLEVQDIFYGQEDVICAASIEYSRAARLYAQTIAQAQFELNLYTTEKNKSNIGTRLVPKIETDVSSRALPSLERNTRGGTAA